jgi:predicted TIM-barrel fold metal-dependent hydrolase
MGSPLALRYRGQSVESVTKCACQSRRTVLAGIGATGAIATLWAAAARAEISSPAVHTIDVHHHLYPPRYRTETYERFVREVGPVLAPISLKWTPDNALDKMNQAGVATAINSVSTPGVWFDDGETGRARARECNEFGAQLARDFPGRFGMFAAIPLPDAEGSLREIEYALDVLKLDGIGVLTSYAGKFLGDPAFTPVFDELNRRNAVVFVHPTSCCGNPVPGLGTTILEVPMDTTRTVASLLINGTFSRYSNIRFIFAQGGGVLTQVFNRIVSAVERMKAEDRAAKVPKGVAYELQRQYYDLASVGFNPAAIAALRKLFPVSQFLYGSDEPFNSTVAINNSLQRLDFSADEFQAIKRNNALRLFPRLN